MISARKAKANRANAKASTGPKTASGKARAAQNARRHGLSLPAIADPAYANDFKILMRQIAGEGASSEIRELAHRIAEAQVDLLRARSARQDLFAREQVDPNNCNSVSAILLEQLLAIDRYERRALSRRKFAIRDFDLARQDKAPGR